MLEVDKAVTRGLLDSALMALGSGDKASSHGWDIEQGAQTLAGPSADPLLKLGRLTSISESSASEFTALQCRFLPAQRAGLSATIDSKPLVSAMPSPVLRGSGDLFASQSYLTICCNAKRRTVLAEASPRLPFSMPTPPGPPMYTRAMSFPGHLIMPESAFGGPPLPACPPGPVQPGTSPHDTADAPPAAPTADASRASIDGKGLLGLGVKIPARPSNE